MIYTGNLSKMAARPSDPVSYTLRLGDDEIVMNDLVGELVSLHFDGTINCRICGKKTKKAYGEGYCYVHFSESPDNAPCILRPELCEGHLGKGRDPQWELEHHVQPHVVYLALSGGIKVGVTRTTQIPTRWIDQGAYQAIRLAELPNRYLAGQLEVALKTFVSDKTPWQAMLKNVQEPLDLLAEKQRIKSLVPADFQAYISPDDTITTLSYPVQAYPAKVQSLSLDKVPELSGVVTGIRGQYLILDGGRVLNIRSHTGYWVRMTW